MKWILTTFGAIAIGYALVAATLFAVQRTLQYFPSRLAPTPAEAGFRGVTEVALTASDGTRLDMWYAPADPERWFRMAGAAGDSSRRNSAPVVLYLHGNAGEIADRPKRWAFLRDQGLGVAYLSYRGFGGSGGTITEAGLHMDADAAHDWLVAQGIAPSDIMVVGESLGSGVAVRLAAERPVGGLLLEAPYSSTADVAARRYPWLPVRLLMLDQYRSIDRIGQVRAPILIQHGTADSTIPFDLGRRLFDLAPEPKTFRTIPGGTHDIVSERATWEVEVDFIRRIHRPGNAGTGTP